MYIFVSLNTFMLISYYEKIWYNRINAIKCIETHSISFTFLVAFRVLACCFLYFSCCFL